MTEALARAVLDALPHAVGVVDADERLAYANPAFWRHADVPESACPLGSPARDVLRLLAYRGVYGPGDPEALVKAALAIDRSRPVRRQIGHPDRTRAFEATSVPLPDGGFAFVTHEITQLLRAREDQAARARLLEGTLDRLASGVARFDAQMRLEVFNPAYGALHGLPGGMLRSGMTHSEIIALLEERGEFAGSDEPGAVAARMEGDRAGPARRTRQRPSGTVLRFDTQPTPDGGFVTEVADITALKRAEDEATRRAALLDGVLDAMPHGVCLYGPDRRVLRVNAAYAAMMDGTVVAVGELLDDIVARRLAQGEYDEATARQVLARHDPATNVWPPMRRVRPNGRVIENSMARLPDGGLISVVTDVTAVHRAEAEARARAELLDAVLEALPDGVCVYGPDRRARMTNPAYRAMLGDAAVRIGESIEELGARRVASGEQTQEMMEALLKRHLGPAAESGQPIKRIRPNGTAMVTRAGRLPDGGHIAVLTDVTALHRAEEELRRRAGLLEASFAAMRHGIAIYDGRRKLLAANARAAGLAGVPERFFAPGSDFDAMIDAQIALGAVTPEHGRCAKAHDRATPYRASRRHPDGRVLEVFSDPTPDGGFVVTFTDVTALHRAEEELGRRAAILEASFATIRHGIAVWGPDRRLLALNDRMPGLLGLPAEMVRPGALFDELIDAQVARGILTPEAATRAKTHDRRLPYCSTRTTADGRILEISSDPTPDGGFVATFTDVTALHRAEQQVRQRAAMQDAMLSNIRHGIILYGPDRRLLATNARTAELTGMPPDRLSQGRLMDEMVEEQVARGQLTVAQAAAMRALDRSRPQHYSRVREDGRVLDTVSEPTPDGGFVITYSDVTEDRRIRAELERARGAAEAASEAKSRFLATMSHELRTPLNAVIGLSDAIALDDDPARTAEYAAMINEAGRHLLQLVDDILDVARSQTGTLSAAEEPFEPGAVIEAAAAAARPGAIAAGLTLATALPPRLPPLRGDPRRLRQVLDKLLSNAVKFTPAGGRITLSAEASAAGLAVRVADTGIGIPPAEWERMFEPFTQLDSSLARRFQGSGLGLHLARALAATIGATLTLEEPEGPGIVAVLRFPAGRLMPIPTVTSAPA
jgi:signal transduction histidine kinase